MVKITSGGNVIQKENYLVVNFAQNFNSKYYKTGDYVQFTFENDVRTTEGTLLIPCNSSLIAKISELESPKWFSRNAKVFLEFTHILMPDGTNIPVALQIAKKKKYLQEGAKETTGKIAGYTLAIGGVGASPDGVVLWQVLVEVIDRQFEILCRVEVGFLALEGYGLTLQEVATRGECHRGNDYYYIIYN